MSEALLLKPDWALPPKVRAWVSTRIGGVSQGPFDSLNLGAHVGDDPESVRENRRRFAEAAGLPREPEWLNQVHGCDIAKAGAAAGLSADAVWADQPGQPCAVMTADCLPVLFADREGTCVAAAHAGWRGLAEGVLEATIATLPVAPGRLLVWLGPAIGPRAFQVGEDVRQAFVQQCADDAAAFQPDGERWLADLYALARARLRRSGILSIAGGEHCTVSEGTRFFSHRRDGLSGRFASVIVMTA